MLAWQKNRLFPTSEQNRRLLEIFLKLPSRELYTKKVNKGFYELLPLIATPADLPRLLERLRREPFSIDFFRALVKINWRGQQN